MKIERGVRAASEANALRPIKSPRDLLAALAFLTVCLSGLSKHHPAERKIRS